MTEIGDTAETPIGSWWEKYTRERESAGEHRLQLFVRSLRPPGAHGTRELLFERIQMVDGQDRIDGFEIQVTGEELCLCERCRSSIPPGTVGESVEKLAKWDGGMLEPSGFTERAVNCSFTDEEYRVLVPPETALGVYLDGTLSGVFPCTDGRVQYGIETFLDSLLEGRPPGQPAHEAGQARHLTS